MLGVGVFVVGVEGGVWRGIVGTKVEHLALGGLGGTEELISGAAMMDGLFFVAILLTVEVQQGVVSLLYSWYGCSGPILVTGRGVEGGILETERVIILGIIGILSRSAKIEVSSD